MILENRKTAIKVRLRAFVGTVVFATIIIIIYTTRILSSPVLGLTKHQFTIFFVLIYIFLLLYSYFLNLNYIYYSDNGHSIIFRYYSLRIFSSRKNSIEIPKKDFIRYDFEKKIFNLKETLVLYRRIKTGVAKYPPISISSLTKEEKIKLKKALSRYIKK